MKIKEEDKVEIKIFMHGPDNYRFGPENYRFIQMSINKKVYVDSEQSKKPIEEDDFFREIVEEDDGKVCKMYISNEDYKNIDEILSNYMKKHNMYLSFEFVHLFFDYFNIVSKFDEENIKLENVINLKDGKFLKKRIK